MFQLDNSVYGKLKPSSDGGSQLGTKTITTNGTYNASDDDLDGYSQVDVQTSGVDLSDYFEDTITGGIGTLTGWVKTIKKLPAFNFSGTDATNLFYQCYCAEEIDLSNIDISNATSTYQMFSQCQNLKSANVSKFDTSKITNMNHMFSGCYKLENLDVSKFDTSNVNQMITLFNQCQSLKKIDVSNFDISNVSDIRFMFYNCRSLTELDLSNFDMSKVVVVLNMLSGCTNLVDLTFGQNLGAGYLTTVSENYSNYTLDLSTDTNLSKNSLISVINGLSDIASLGVNPQQLVLGETNLAKLTEEEIAIATNKGWTVS